MIATERRKGSGVPNQLVDGWKSRIPKAYQPPELTTDRDITRGVAELISLKSLVERLCDDSGGGAARSWYVRGGAGLGKTSLVYNVAVALSELEIPCQIIDHRVLKSWGEGAQDAREVFQSIRPAQIDAPLWNSWIKHGKLVILVDGLNEIRLRFQYTPLWRRAVELVSGNHHCPVLATSRSFASDLFGEVPLRDVIDLELRPFSEAQTRKFLGECGVDVDSSLRMVEDAGLGGLAANPLILKQLGSLLSSNDPNLSALPRNRASLLQMSFQHAVAKGVLPAKSAQDGLEIDAILATAAVCAVFDERGAPNAHPQRFSKRDVAGILKAAWPDCVAETLAQVPNELHLAREIGDIGCDEAEFIHQSFVDFGIALLFRDGAPPQFLMLDCPDLALTLGDWVGLQPDIDAAVDQAIALSEKCGRPDLLVDVVAANEGCLSEEAKCRLWPLIGRGLTGPRKVRDRTADHLSGISTDLARQAISHGILAGLSNYDSALAASVKELLLQDRLNSMSFQRTRRRREWAKRRDGFAREIPSPVISSQDPVRLKAQLKDGKQGWQRGSAAKMLGVLGDRSAVEPLREALKNDEDEIVRGSAANALGTLGDRGAVEPLCGALLDAAANVRGSAANALGTLRDRAAVEPLCAALLDEAARVRGSAANALGTLGDRGAVEPLCAALLDAAAVVRGSAANALGALGDRSAVEPLCAAILDAAAHVRGSAADALGALGDRRAVEPLRQALKDDEDEIVRGSAANALGAMGDRSAVEPLCAALLDLAPRVRGSAGNALGALGDRRAVEPLCAALLDGAATVRGSAANALGTLGDRRAVEPLRTALIDDEDEIVRASAAKGLGLLGDLQALGCLELALSDSSKETRLSATSALARLLDYLEPDAPEQVIGLLYQTAKFNSEPSARTSAVLALVRHGRLDDELVRYLIDDRYERADRRKRDTDWGVQGQVAAAVLQGYLHGSPKRETLEIVARLLADPETSIDSIRPALAPLFGLPADRLREALADLHSLLPVLRERVQKIFESLRTKLALADAAESSLDALKSDAVDLVRKRFRRSPTSWYDTGGTARSGKKLTVVLLAAVPTEAKAIYAGLRGRGLPIVEDKVAGRTIERCELPLRNGSHCNLILAQPVEKGPQSMQSLVEALTATLSPNILFMVGMCGGIREHGARGNTVILAKQVLNYQRRRIDSSGPALTPLSYRCHPSIPERLNAAIRRGAMEGVSIGEVPGVSILTKDIASGEFLINDLQSKERAEIVGFSDDLVGAEMEGHGLYHPMWESAIDSELIPYALIKGVSDYCDGQMQENKEQRQTDATLRALAVTCEIIENW